MIHMAGFVAAHWLHGGYMVERHSRLVLATGNRHKAGEIRELLDGGMGNHLPELSCAADYSGIPEPVEDGATFEENALIKATAWMEATGFPALADDSGLVVDALDGKPGIHSARYAPTAQACIERLLQELDQVPAAERSATFMCVAALVVPSGLAFVRHGEVNGRIVTSVRGREGFGYDPAFELTGGRFAGMTMAEISLGNKNTLSHRGRAIEALMPELVRLFRSQP